MPGIAPAPFLPLAEALELVRNWRKAGRRIVFTNGCFDLLHPGHAAYLFEARALGDALIVGLNDDDSIRRLKGPERPVNPLVDRAAMLTALKPVDLVVPFSEDTPLELIRAIMPDVLVKGGDYREEQIVGAPEVRAAEGEVVVLPFLDGHSSTGLIDRIRRR
ncbi:MAG: D-glycero-beta-D-manno-heptose 1-phosphate adenylyltransferase [Mariprofundaceae bacterium]